MIPAITDFLLRLPVGDPVLTNPEDPILMGFILAFVVIFIVGYVSCNSDGLKIRECHNNFKDQEIDPLADGSRIFFGGSKAPPDNQFPAHWGPAGHDVVTLVAGVTAALQEESQRRFSFFGPLVVAGEHHGGALVVGGG